MHASKTSIWVVAALLWSLLICGIAWKTTLVSQKTIGTLAEVQARASFNEELDYQKWVAMHGGVYVPTTADTPTAPFLAHIPERDIVTPSERLLTLVNHTYISRQIQQSVNPESGIKRHITSLNPIRPENQPDAWEKSALDNIARQQNRVDSTVRQEGHNQLRMMFPLRADKNCLKCHSEQGYKPGDTIGGISISVPFAPFRAAIQSTAQNIISALLLVWLFGLALIAFAYSLIKKQFKSVESALVESRTLEKRFRTLFEQAAGGICVADMETGTIVDCNQGMADLVGRPRNGLIGQSQAMLFPKSAHHNSDSEIKRIWRNRENSTGNILERQLVRRDGELVDVQIKAAPLEIDGRKLLQGYFYDITAQKRMQAQAFRSSQLASVGELAASVAHEINNPIGGVINYSQILLNRNSTDSFEQDILKKIIKEGKRVAHIVKSLLAFSHKGVEKKYISDFNKIIEGPLSLLKALILRDSITVRLQIPKELPAVKCNPQQIEQLVLNLINNSRYALNEKYPGKDQNKVIEISAAASPQGSTDTLQLCILDYGTGIAADHIDSIKEAFYTTKPAEDGTGLGLSICEEIVTNHSGCLDIESKQGEFTRVTITLPSMQNRQVA